MGLDRLAEVEHTFRSTIDFVEGYQKNKHKDDDKVIEKANRYRKFAFDAWGHPSLEAGEEM